MPATNRMLYASMALFVQGTLHDNPELRAANNHFRMATIFFHHASGFKLLGPMQNLDQIEVDYLKQPYSAVPDKLTAPAKSPVPAKRPAKIGTPGSYLGS